VFAGERALDPPHCRRADLEGVADQGARLDDGATGATRLRMQLSAALGWSLTYSQGRAGPALSIPLELAERLDDKDYRLRALWGLCIDRTMPMQGRLRMIEGAPDYCW
jgi:hypothetical protein